MFFSVVILLFKLHIKEHTLKTPWFHNSKDSPFRRNYLWVSDSCYSFVFVAAAISWMSWFRTDDRFYVPLPLYHTAGGAMSVGQALIFGSCVVIRKKFSASAYISDIKKYECTVPQHLKYVLDYITLSLQWFMDCFINNTLLCSVPFFEFLY